jgi:small conductance mechanosensitive channel
LLSAAARRALMDMSQLAPILYQKAIDVGSKVVGLVVLWIIGRFVIGFVKRIVEKSMRARDIEKTLIAYVESVISVLLNILLVAVLLGFVGVETTTFAGLLAAAGLAIGAAWSGLLGNFAAGAFIVILRPYKKGDFVTVAGGITGTVHEIGMFVTMIDTMDNVRTMVGNNKIFGDNIQNFTINPYRRVDRLAQLAHGADHKKAIEILKDRLAAIPNVEKTPAPDVTIVDFTLAGPVLAVRPYCHNDHYWQVYFDTNRTIRDALGEAGLPVPETHHHINKS